MNQHLVETARQCLAASHAGTMAFPEIVGALLKAGFESYTVDFRRGKAIYYLPEGESVELPADIHRAAIPATLDTAAMQAAIREAQQLVPGYTYAGFCAKAMAAGCVGYMVSFVGRRALYVGRSGEAHVELFPQ
jgi:uncharacterized protein YbcV (DUF1398 family)